MLSETSAVNFFGFFNFVFLLDENSVDHGGPLCSGKRVKWANHNLLKFILCNGCKGLKAIDFNSGKLWCVVGNFFIVEN